MHGYGQFRLLEMKIPQPEEYQIIMEKQMKSVSTTSSIPSICLPLDQMSAVMNVIPEMKMAKPIKASNKLRHIMIFSTLLTLTSLNSFPTITVYKH